MYNCLLINLDTQAKNYAVFTEDFFSKSLLENILFARDKEESGFFFLNQSMMIELF